MRYCRYFLLFVFLCLFLLCFVAAEGERREIHGFWEAVDRYYGVEVIEEEPSLLEGGLLVSEAPMLMSISPEGINSGVLNLFMYSSNDYNGLRFVNCNETASTPPINSVATQRMTYTDLYDSDTTYTDTITITSPNNIVICESGKIFNISLSNIAFYWDYPDNGITNSCYLQDTSYLDISIYYKLGDGSLVEGDFEDIVFSPTSDRKYMYLSATSSVALTHDIYGLYIYIKYDVTQAFAMPLQVALNRSSRYFYPSHTVGFYNSEFIFREVEQTNGLLSGIIDWLKGIYNGIIDIPINIINGIKETLTNLFVPATSKLTALKNRIDSILSQRFGAIYESMDMILFYAEAFIDFEHQDTITFPEFTLEFPDGEFTFGGWEVDVVPDAFEDFLAPLRVFINVIISLAFVNSMYYKFDRLIQGDT